MQKTEAMTVGLYEGIFHHVYTVMDELSEGTDPASNARAAYAACITRLTGHDFMDFRTDTTTGVSTGGSDGCVNFNDPINAGLLECVQANDYASIYAEHCDKISLADFLVVVAEAAMSRQHSTYDHWTLFP